MIYLFKNRNSFFLYLLKIELLRHVDLRLKSRKVESKTIKSRECSRVDFSTCRHQNCLKKSFYSNNGCDMNSWLKFLQKCLIDSLIEQRVTLRTFWCFQLPSWTRATDLSNSSKTRTKGMWQNLELRHISKLSMEQWQGILKFKKICLYFFKFTIWYYN